jgi:hypothetical protein
MQFDTDQRAAVANHRAQLARFQQLPIRSVEVTRLRAE